MDQHQRIIFKELMNITNRAGSELGVGLGGEGADLLGRSHSGDSESDERGAGEHG
jgi:hypothetical protein